MGSAECFIEGCGRPSWRRGWCRRHYERWRLHGDPFWVPAPRRRRNCAVPDCGRTHYARGWCSPHYYRWQVYGDPLGGRQPPHPNPWTGSVTCPKCASSEWTLPWDGDKELSTWRCVACHLDLSVGKAAA